MTKDGASPRKSLSIFIHSIYILMVLLSLQSLLPIESIHGQDFAPGRSFDTAFQLGVTDKPIQLHYQQNLNEDPYYLRFELDRRRNLWLAIETDYTLGSRAPAMELFYSSYQPLIAHDVPPEDYAEQLRNFCVGYVPVVRIPVVFTPPQCGRIEVELEPGTYFVRIDPFGSYADSDFSVIEPPSEMDVWFQWQPTAIRSQSAIAWDVDRPLVGSFTLGDHWYKGYFPVERDVDFSISGAVEVFVYAEDDLRNPIAASNGARSVSFSTTGNYTYIRVVRDGDPGPYQLGAFQFIQQESQSDAQPPPPAEPALPLTQTYRSAAGNLAFQYPAGWVVNPAGMTISSDRGFDPLTSRPTSGQAGLAFMTPEDVRRDFSLTASSAQEAAWQMIDAMQLESPGVIETATVSGRPAARVTGGFVRAASGSASDAVIVYTVDFDNGDIVVIIGDTASSELPRFAATIDAIVASMRFETVNRAPEIVPMPDEVIQIGEDAYFVVSATDPENEVLLLRVESSMTAVGVGPVSGFRFALRGVSPGTSRITVRVIDPNANTASIDFLVTVPKPTLPECYEYRYGEPNTLNPNGATCQFMLPFYNSIEIPNVLRPVSSVDGYYTQVPSAWYCISGLGDQVTRTALYGDRFCSLALSHTGGFQAQNQIRVDVAAFSSDEALNNNMDAIKRLSDCTGFDLTADGDYAQCVQPIRNGLMEGEIIARQGQAILRVQFNDVPEFAIDTFERNLLDAMRSSFAGIVDEPAPPENNNVPPVDQVPVAVGRAPTLLPDVPVGTRVITFDEENATINWPYGGELWSVTTEDSNHILATSIGIWDSVQVPDVPYARATDVHGFDLRITDTANAARFIFNRQLRQAYLVLEIAPGQIALRRGGEFLNRDSEFVLSWFDSSQLTDGQWYRFRIEQDDTASLRIYMNDRLVQEVTTGLIEPDGLVQLQTLTSNSFVLWDNVIVPGEQESTPTTPMQDADTGASVDMIIDNAVFALTYPAGFAVRDVPPVQGIALASNEGLLDRVLLDTSNLAFDFMIPDIMAQRFRANSWLSSGEFFGIVMPKSIPEPQSTALEMAALFKTGACQFCDEPAMVEGSDTLVVMHSRYPTSGNLPFEQAVFVYYTGGSRFVLADFIVPAGELARLEPQFVAVLRTLDWSGPPANDLSEVSIANVAVSLPASWHTVPADAGILYFGTTREAIDSQISVLMGGSFRHFPRGELAGFIFSPAELRTLLQNYGMDPDNSSFEELAQMLASDANLVLGEGYARYSGSISLGEPGRGEEADPGELMHVGYLFDFGDGARGLFDATFNTDQEARYEPMVDAIAQSLHVTGPSPVVGAGVVTTSPPSVDVELHNVLTDTSNRRALWSVAVNDKGLVATGGDDGTLWLWDGPSGGQMCQDRDKNPQNDRNKNPQLKCFEVG